MGLEWLQEDQSEAIEPAVEAEVVQVVERLPAALPAQDGLRLLRDDMLRSNLEVMDAASRFHEIGPDDTEPPAAWVERYGREAALRRLKVAQYAHLPAKFAPVGLTMAPKVALGIMSIDAKLKSPPRSLNLTIQMPAPVMREE